MEMFFNTNEVSCTWNCDRNCTKKLCQEMWQSLRGWVGPGVVVKEVWDLRRSRGHWGPGGVGV